MHYPVGVGFAPQTAAVRSGDEASLSAHLVVVGASRTFCTARDTAVGHSRLHCIIRNPGWGVRRTGRHHLSPRGLGRFRSFFVRLLWRWLCVFGGPLHSLLALRVLLLLLLLLLLLVVPRSLACCLEGRF